MNYLTFDHTLVPFGRTIDVKLYKKCREAQRLAKVHLPEYLVSILAIISLSAVGIFS